MTNYADVPAASTLHREQETVTAALDMLTNSGGTMISFTVGPSSVDVTMPLMPVGIATPLGTVTQATLDNLIGWLTQRKSDLTAQLAALGVT